MRRIGICILSIVILIWSVGCGDDPSNVVRMGTILQLTGPGQSYGEQEQKGMEIAASQINEGQGPKLELIYKDSGGKKEKAVEHLEVLHSQGIRFIADIMGTGIALHATPTFTEKKMLVLSGVNTGPKFTLDGGRFFFRIIPSDGVAAEQLVNWAVENKRLKGAVLADVSDWGFGLRDVLQHAYEQAGGTIVSRKEINKDESFFQPIVSEIKSKAPQVVFLLTYPREGALFLKEAKRQKLDAEFMGTDNFTSSELTKLGQDACVGVKFVVPGQASVNQTKQSEFISAYAAKYGDKEPPFFAAYGYDVVNLLYQAARTANNDVEKAIEYLQTNMFQGATGAIQFDQNHDIVVPDYTRKMYQQDTNGGYVAVNTQ
jgi:branched-chain amino acid transport system substrate-binding protein